MERKQNTRKRKPIFLRQQSRLKKLEKGWRAPRGGESKLRKRKKGRFIPTIGYSSGKKEKQLIVGNMKDLEIAKVATIKTVVMSSVLGVKKKIKLGEEAKKFGITFSNISVERLKKRLEEKRLGKAKKVEGKKKAEKKGVISEKPEEKGNEDQKELEKKKILERRI